MARIGRPPVYTGNVERHIVALVRKFGATGARKRLNARNGSKLAQDRSANVSPLGISMPTVLKLAERHGVELKRGRPAKAA